jgi:hypothetical protein
MTEDWKNSILKYMDSVLNERDSYYIFNETSFGGAIHKTDDYEVAVIFALTEGFHVLSYRHNGWLHIEHTQVDYGILSMKELFLLIPPRLSIVKTTWAGSTWEWRVYDIYKSQYDGKGFNTPKDAMIHALKSC